MVELENSVELLVFMHHLAQETGNALKVYTNNQDDLQTTEDNEKLQLQTA